ncbi:ABC transporter substrate-binding protein [Methylocystis iwaonis]|uniref:ABC transporter substrate-binding protein n=1 Tax=Methylocystis iwaonis TaxID=2885079 RepID=A0ABM8E698_9HYPH|nr:ABC transporter substrate-binding protein [Methylocystis iwaonis]BDV33433.1 ABC transporter substrate-binding protein [Methylocystis iwaonis]
MKRLAFLAAAVLFAAPAQAEKLRLALQKTGTTGWEMAVVKAFGLDKEAGLELEVTELASPEAGKIAIQGGSADLIVSDWLWVARERAQGAKLTLYPYSTGVGAVMTRDASIKSVKDLVGKKLGVAGGPLDKSWLMLEAFALKQGVDLAKSATILYGAPPLIAEKALQGEIDAALEFWNFAADLEGKGFARAIDIVDVEKALGAKGNVVITGYVFDDAFAAKNKDALARFFAMTGKAKALIATDDKAWAAAASRIGQKDAATLDIYRKRYVAGIPKRPIAEEEKDAAALYKVLAETGGEKLVGPGKTLAPGTFYKGGEAAAR